MKVILFTGGRDIYPGKIIANILDEEKPDLVIVGCAHGVDLAVRDVCHEHGIPVAQFVADWRKHGRKAGVLRNQDMVSAMVELGGTQVYALPGPNSRGTYDCMRRARSHDLNVEVR